jgi:hypothetical protein
MEIDQGQSKDIQLQAGGEDDVIAMASVSFTENFVTELAKCWDVMVGCLHSEFQNLAFPRLTYRRGMVEGTCGFLLKNFHK